MFLRLVGDSAESSRVLEVGRVSGCQVNTGRILSKACPLLS